MGEIYFEGSSLDVQSGETVLECLLRHQIAVKSGCRAGACQSCLLRIIDGPIPAKAQSGLSDHLVESGHILSCLAKAAEVRAVGFAGPGSSQTVDATISALEWIHRDIIRVSLEPADPLRAMPGQFVRLTINRDLVRSYSIAQIDEGIELHVRILPDGKMGTYLREKASVGDLVKLEGPYGRCHYRPAYSENSMLLIGSGTGLAPLIGVVRSALAHGHQGQIRLYHGASHSDDLYFREELKSLLGDNYISCASEVVNPADRVGSPLDVALSDIANLKGWRVFAAGNPALVKATQKKCFLAGANLKDIHVDPFENQV